MNEGEELSYVVCPLLQRAYMKQFDSRFRVYSPVFHFPGFPLQAASTDRLSAITEGGKMGADSLSRECSPILRMTSK